MREIVMHRKLLLSKTTLRALTTDQLGHVQGGNNVPTKKHQAPCERESDGVCPTLPHPIDDEP